MPEPNHDAAHQALLEALPLPYIAADLAGRITGWNQRAEALTGLDASRLRGASLLDTLVGPEARERFTRGLEEIRAGRSFAVETTSRNARGEPVALRLHMSALRGASGEPVGAQLLIEDDSERVRLARALEESEQRFADVYGNAPVAYFEFGPVEERHRIRRWNARARELIDRTEEELRAGVSGLDLIARDQVGEIETRVVSDLFGRGIDNVTDVPLVRKDGSVRWLRTVQTPIRDASGASVGTRAVAEDVTELRAAREALARSEAEFRDLYENAPVAYFVLDRELRFARANQRYVDLFGVDPELVAPGRDTRAVARRSPEIEQGAAIVESEVLGAGRSLTFELPIQRHDGTQRWVRAQMNPVRDAGGAIVAVRGLLEDLTEIHAARAALAESEAEMRELYENAPLAYFVLANEPEMRLLRWNARSAELFGVEPSALRVGVPLGELIRPTPEAAAAMAEAIDAAGRQGREYYVELAFRRLDGEQRFVRSHVRPMRNARGEIFGIGSLTEDLTEIRRAEEALHEREARIANLVEQATDAIVSIDAEGRIVDFNRGAAQVLRCPAAEAIGAPIARFGTEQSLSVLGSLMARIEADPTARVFVGAEQGVQSRRLDGTTFTTEATLSRSSVGGKPLYTFIFRDADERRAHEEELARLRSQSEYLQEELREVHQFEDIVGRSRTLAATLEQVSQVAPTESTVLILGETGTGKELIARALHARSPRAERPLVKLNCAAVPAGLVESELFGHERGSFTGATERRIGRFERANGGTLFLDEVGELPLETQSKLLRVLQEREFERVGGSQTLRADVRVIAATNRDLLAMVAAGRFRSDLFYRLNVFPVSVPPLRERREDIPLLASLFIARYAPQIGRAAKRLSPRAVERLTGYAWPGNVRELENVIERALILAPADAAELEVPETVLPLAAAPASRAAPAARPEAPLPGAPHAAPPASDHLEEVERAHIVATLAATGWRIEGERGAAEQLGLKPSTLRSRMQKLGIRREG